MRIIFHTFTFQMGNVDDVDISPIYDWQQTEHGRWVMKNAQDLKYYTSAVTNTFGYRVTIGGEIKDGPLVTEYFLRWPNKESS